MAMYNRNGWLDTAMDQVRCKPEHKAIRAELLGHIEDKEQYFLDSGVEPTQAGRAALEAMGDPVAVGKELDKAHPVWWAKLYAACKVVIVLLCMVFLFFSLDFFIGSDMEGNWNPYPLRMELTDPSEIEGAIVLEDVYKPVKQSGYSIDVTQVYWKPVHEFYRSDGVERLEDVLRIDIKVSNPRPWATAPIFMSRLLAQGDEDTVLHQIYHRSSDGSYIRANQNAWYSVVADLRYWNAWYFTVELSGVELGEEVTLYRPGNEELGWTFRVEVSQ